MQTMRHRTAHRTPNRVTTERTEQTMKLDEKIKITMERLNSNECSYESLIMRFLVGTYNAAPGYRMEILSSRETSFETFAVEVSVYMPRQKTAYATFFIELNSMNIQLACTQDEPKMIYYRGSFEDYKAAEYTAYCDCYNAGIVDAA